MMATPTPRLSRARRREQILAAATEAFATSGFAPTSLDEVAAAAGVARVILYRHFDSKADLYEEVLARMCARLDAHFDQPDGGFADDSIDGLLAVATESPAGFKLLFQHALREPDFKAPIEKFRADIAEAAFAQISQLVQDVGLGSVGRPAGTGRRDRSHHRLARRRAPRTRAGRGPCPACGDGRGRGRSLSDSGRLAATQGTPGEDESVNEPAPRTCETPTAKQRRVWDKAAAGYDRQIAFYERVWFAGGREWIGTRARGRVLETAIGTGRSLPHYATEAAVTGVDLSPQMLALARETAATLGREVDLRQADAAALPFDEASFDTAVCVLALCSIPNPGAAIAEMFRVLKPGGELLLLDHVGSTLPPLYAAQWLVERVTRRTAGEHMTRRHLPLVESTGFDVVEAERLKVGTIERVRATKPG